MRLVTANYLFLPGFPLLKFGQVKLQNRIIVDVIDTGGKICEKPGLEFYGGLLVAGGVQGQIIWETGDDLLERLSFFYRENPGKVCVGLCLIVGADLLDFKWIKSSGITRLI